jgi:ketosteroid isomerase-like protein
MSTSNVTECLAGHIAIRDLLDRYTNALNHRDWSALEGLFACDGIWEAVSPVDGAPPMRFEGAANCAKGIAQLVAPTDLCVQSNHAPVIVVDGQRATSISTINETILMDATPGLMVVWGTYYVFQREADGEWRFAERTFRPTWSDMGGSKGQIFRRFPK